MRVVLLIAAVVLFAVASIFGFAGDVSDLDTIVAIIAAGLAAFAAASLPIP